jgi:hypothetical protein
MDDIVGVVYTTRPNDAKHRRKNNPGHFPMLIFRNGTVAAHFMAVYQQSKVWNKQFQKTSLSTVLCSKAVLASVIPSLLPVDPREVKDLTDSNRDIQISLQDTGGDTFLASQLGNWTMVEVMTGVRPSSGKGSDPAEERRIRREANAAKAAQSAEGRIMEEQYGGVRPAEPSEDRQLHMRETMEALAASNPQAALNFLYSVISQLDIEEETLTQQTLGGLLRRQPLDPEKQREGKADGDGSAMVE